MIRKKYRIAAISILILIGTECPRADSPMLGETASPEAIARRDIGIMPDGTGLPEGSGNVAQGKRVYDTKCIACHGPEGAGGSADQLAGASNALTDDYPEKTIGAYWPYATTLFDLIRRSMPMDAPGSLSDNEVYALTAYLLYLNNIIATDNIMDAITLPKTVMPNRDGFINVYEEAAP